MKKLIAIITAGAVAAAPLTVQAGAVVGATEFTQIFNNLELIMQNVKQLEMVKNQLESYMLQVQNTRIALRPMVWDDAMNIIKQLQDITLRAKSWSWSLANFEEEYRRQFPSYDDFLRGESMRPEAFSEQYTSWNEQVDAAIADAIRAAKVSGDRSAQVKADQLLRDINDRGQDADGQNDILKASLDFAHFQSKELVALRQLVSQHVMMHGQYMAKNEAEAAARKAESQKALDNSYKWTTGREPGYP